MKLFAAPLLAVAVALMAFPALFASGEPTMIGCGVGGDLGRVLATIRHLESRGDYSARADGSSASGAYQFVDGTWDGFGGYVQAWQAPPSVQDAKAAEHIQRILDGNGGSVEAVPVVWYIGHLPAPGDPEWDQVPVPDAGNVLTPREYQQRWLTEYQRQVNGIDEPIAEPSPVVGCSAGAPLTVLADGFAYPGPPDLFAQAAVDEPHHDYPAWDWIVPTGTPVYAVAAGEVVNVQYWPYNWWDRGCSDHPDGCETCGIGVTIRDAAGTRWAYCHGSAVHVKQDDVIAAGTQILTSGNTGRSGTPHIHIELTTADRHRRCPQPLLRSLQTVSLGIEPGTLPTTGCYFVDSG